nr:MAG TPA: hypothetical protein [Caudoviricetes sp.]DAU82032.1 MAG TPA: hypothetical protein [Caudoviricetes sp.]
MKPILCKGGVFIGFYLQMQDSFLIFIAKYQYFTIEWK